MNSSSFLQTLDASGTSSSTEIPRRRLLAIARQARLTELIARRGFVTVAETASEFDVSEMTIRRDLAQLESRGVVERSHGGAASVREQVIDGLDADEPPFNARRHKNAGSKSRIVDTAIGLIRPGEAVGIDSGTTTLLLAERLADHIGLHVFTNNLRAAGALAESNNQVYVLGGRISREERSVVGPVASSQIRQFWLDRVFIGVSGLIEEGIFDYTVEESEVKRAFIARAAEVVLLCDASKFRRRSLAKVCDLSQIDVLVTDAPPPPSLAEALAVAAVRVIVAEAEMGFD